MWLNAKSIDKDFLKVNFVSEFLLDPWILEGFVIVTNLCHLLDIQPTANKHSLRWSGSGCSEESVNTSGN